MGPLLVVAFALLTMALVAVQSMKHAAAAQRRNHDLLSSMASRLQAGTLESYVAATDPVEETPPMAPRFVDPEMQGLLDMQEVGLDPDNPEHVQKWNNGDSSAFMGESSVGGAV